MRQHLEDDMQEMVITWCELNKAKYPQLDMIFAIPNGGKRNIREAARFKKQGVKAGVPDLFLAVPIIDKSVGFDFYFGGLFIEMKVGKNKLTNNQIDFMNKLRNKRYAFFIAYSFEEAVKAICEYLDIPFRL